MNRLFLYNELYKFLNKKINKKDIINDVMNLKTLKNVHIYCKIKNFTGQKTGPLIEKYIIDKYNFIKNIPSLCIGDCSKKVNDKDINIEIKGSLGGETNKQFNYVQIRLHHNIDYYLLTSYYLSFENLDKLGDLYIFLLKKDEIKDLIIKYGQYAHGTKNENGKRLLDDIDNIDNNNNNKEYALRPKYNDNLWKELLKYKIEENEINKKCIGNEDKTNNNRKKRRKNN